MLVSFKLWTNNVFEVFDKNIILSWSGETPWQLSYISGVSQFNVSDRVDQEVPYAEKFIIKTIGQNKLSLFNFCKKTVLLINFIGHTNS